MPSSSSGGSTGMSGSSSSSNMEPLNAAGLLGAARWAEEGLYLKEFVHKHSLPKLVRVVKGNYLGVLGVPSIANSVSSQHFLLVSTGRRRRLLAQGVKFKEGRVAATGPKVAIPAGYGGYFELLSEDGRATKSIESVAELARRFPDSVLVREDLRAFVSRSDDAEAVRERSRVIARGETLILVGEVMAVKAGQQGSKEKFLRCLDAKGENVYLPCEMRGCKFSAVAKEGNISGVHTAGNLLNKRPPFMARLVHGDGPASPSSTHAQQQQELRILATLDEECLYGLVLGKDSTRVVSLPASALLKVQAASNGEEMETSKPEMARLVERCRERAEAMADAMTIHDIAFARDIRLNGGGINNSDLSYQQRRKARRSSQVLMSHPVFNTKDDKAPKDEYEEIEQIYDYVRGFAPMPRSARGWRYDAVMAPRDDELNKNNNSNNNNSKQQQQQPDQQTPPEPPPIETMPTGRPPALLMPPTTQSQSMEFAYCATPPPSSPMTPGAATGQWEYLQTATVDRNMRGRVGAAANKKRQRSSANNISTNENSENVYGDPATTPTGRFVKTGVASSGGRHAHRFFRLQQNLHRGFGGGKEHPLYLQQSTPHHNHHHHHQSSLTLSRSNLYGKPTSPAPFFQLRYKSLNNLANCATSSHNHHNSSAAEYDTMESSNSGGKTSGGDSGGSRTLPEKRSRRLSRPKSLTNLMLGGGGGGKYNVASSSSSGAPATGVSKYFPGYHRPQTAAMSASHHSNKLGGGTLSGKAAKRVGTLYL